MAGFAGFAQWVQAAVNCSSIPSFFEGPRIPALPFPSLNCVIDEDVTMKDCSTPPDMCVGVWDQLRVFAQSLITKDPQYLTAHEVALLHILNQHHGSQQDEVKRNCRKQADAINDHVMRSPTQTHQTLLFCQPPVTPEPGQQEQPREAFQPENPDFQASAGSSAFANIRHHPYARFDINGPSSLEVPRWVKRKASRRTMLSGQVYQERGVSGAYEQEPGPRDPRVEAKILELLNYARIRTEESGGIWNEEFFLKGYVATLREVAERLVAEGEGTDTPPSTNDVADADSGRDIHDGYFAQGVQYLEDICKRELDEQKKLVQSVHEKIKTVEDLDDAIGRLRRKLEELERERSHYPAKKEVLEEEFRAAWSAQDEAAKRFDELLGVLQSAMEQNDQDFYAAWKTFQTYYDLPADLWPPSVSPPPPENHSPSPPRHDTPPPISTKSSPPISEQPSPNMPPPSSASTLDPSMPPPSSPSHFHFKFLPVRRPRTDAERIARYNEGWALLRCGALVDGSATFDQMPWPVFFDVSKDQLDQFTPEAIQVFILHPDRMRAKSLRKHMQDELRRWHPDKMASVLEKFIPEDRAALSEGIEIIGKYLLELPRS